MSVGLHRTAVKLRRHRQGAKNIQAVLHQHKDLDLLQSNACLGAWPSSVLQTRLPIRWHAWSTKSLRLATVSSRLGCIRNAAVARQHDQVPDSQR